jgi:predicted RNase H-like HicB family nuclease
MMIQHFPIIVEQDDDGVYIVTCPLFRGCRSYGATIDEAMENIKEAISVCMEEEQEDIS